MYSIVWCMLLVSFFFFLSLVSCARGGVDYITRVYDVYRRIRGAPEPTNYNNTHVYAIGNGMERRDERFSCGVSAHRHNRIKNSWTRVYPRPSPPANCTLSCARCRRTYAADTRRKSGLKAVNGRNTPPFRGKRGSDLNENGVYARRDVVHNYIAIKYSKKKKKKNTLRTHRTCNTRPVLVTGKYQYVYRGTWVRRAFSVCVFSPNTRSLRVYGNLDFWRFYSINRTKRVS